MANRATVDLIEDGEEEEQTVSVHVGHVKKKFCYVSVGSKTLTTATSEPTEVRIRFGDKLCKISTLVQFMIFLPRIAHGSTCKGEKVFARSGVAYFKKSLQMDAPEPLDTDDHTEIFGPDVRPCPVGKTRPAKKTKSETTESNEGSASGSISESLSEDLRRKLQAASSAYEAKKEQELAYTECKKLEFLMIDHNRCRNSKPTLSEINKKR
ncbi:hypothetical protein Tco_0073993 [Tanacetum coccineum]